MIGRLVSAAAGSSIARTLGGAAAGPAGLLIGTVLPVVLPSVARRFGPLGMAASAVGTVLFSRWLSRRNARRAALGSVATAKPEAVLGSPVPPDALEGELLKDY